MSTMLGETYRQAQHPPTWLARGLWMAWILWQPPCYPAEPSLSNTHIDASWLVIY